MFTPIFIRILKCLRDAKSGKTGEELAVIIKASPEDVSKALEKLIAVDLVAQEEGAYLYNDTQKNNETLERLTKLHETVKEKPDKELLIRGVICLLPSRYLLHLPTLIEIFEQEGINEPELTRFLEQEIASSYLKRITVVYLREKTPFVPACMPPDYFDYLKNRGIIDQDKQKFPAGNDNAGEYEEEDYLITQYPLELVNPAKEYLERERMELKNHLRRNGLFEWNQQK